MPFIPHTPESLIPRSDSKNAATTCKGITLSGRPCRRDLKSQRSDDGVLAVVSKDDDATRGAAAYFCHDHKDQAAKLTQSKPTSGAAALYPLNKRSSTDTLMERLGVVDLNHERPGRRKKQASANKQGLPQKWQDTNQQTHEIDLQYLRDPPSQTENLLALIPKSLSPQTTSLLLSELAKPVSSHDEEGYIYIFMLTPSGTGSKDASALLSTTPLPSPRQRHPSSTAQIPLMQTQNDGSILLKIGRASNIQRRMNEWTRQCDHDLSLVRYYPYIPSASSRSSPPTANDSGVPRKVPHAHKVERLIHIELADRRVKRNCENCGKEHREWFEVRGDRQGVKAVDEVVRRWVKWGEGR
ncbi:hypothetical protein XPA_007978 [Xanthoria parietina]